MHSMNEALRLAYNKNAVEINPYQLDMVNLARLSRFLNRTLVASTPPIVQETFRKESLRLMGSVSVAANSEVHC